MKRLMKLIKANNLEFKIEFIESVDKYKITVRQGRTMIAMLLDAFDISRGYSERELCDTIVDYICDNLRIDEEGNL